MSIKGLAIVTLGSAALAVAGYASTSSAVTLLNPIVLEPAGGIESIGPEIPRDGKPLPQRPPGRSLYRPGPRNPISSLE